MKFTREIVEKVFENLGKTPESIHEFNDGTSFDVDLEDVWGDSLRVVINSNNNIIVWNFQRLLTINKHLMPTTLNSLIQLMWRHGKFTNMELHSELT